MEQKATMKDVWVTVGLAIMSGLTMWAMDLFPMAAKTIVSAYDIVFVGIVLLGITD